MKNMDYAQRLEKLDLPTLLHRRERGDMIQVWKHFNSYNQSTLSSSFIHCPRTNRNHRHQITWNRPKDGTNGIQANSFYYRISRPWNNLPQKVVEAKTIDGFKSGLDDAWENHPTKRSINTLSSTNDLEQFEEASF